MTFGRFSLSSFARERPNDSAWLPPLCAWRKMKISSSAMMMNGMNWKTYPMNGVDVLLTTVISTPFWRSVEYRSLSSGATVVNFCCWSISSPAMSRPVTVTFLTLCCCTSVKNAEYASCVVGAGLSTSLSTMKITRMKMPRTTRMPLRCLPIGCETLLPFSS